MSAKFSEYLTAGQVRARFGDASRMWLHRRLQKDGFPSPVRFGGRTRHFRLSEVEAWEKMMIARTIDGPKPATLYNGKQ